MHHTQAQIDWNFGKDQECSNAVVENVGKTTSTLIFPLTSIQMQIRNMQIRKEASDFAM